MPDTNSVNREAVAEEVRALMGRRRVSQVRLAKHLDMSQSALSRRLNGEHPFDTDDLFRIAELFDVEVTRLFPGPKSAWFTADELRANGEEVGPYGHLNPVRLSRDTVGETGAATTPGSGGTEGETAGWRDVDMRGAAQIVAV